MILPPWPPYAPPLLNDFRTHLPILSRIGLSAVTGDELYRIDAIYEADVLLVIAIARLQDAPLMLQSRNGRSVGLM